MNISNPKVDKFIARNPQWQEEFTHLRVMLLNSQLTEELKWGVPCYALDGKNVALIHGFKEYCAILFTKGALLSDPAGILIQQTENVQSARQVRFTGLQDLLEKEDAVRAYILEAMELERSGAKVEFKKTTEFPMAEELSIKFAEIPELQAAFENLTPGRQRAYLLYFSSAKQAKTREARVEKYIPQILDGKGLDDE